MIKLNEFITESLKQIIDGVADAQTYAKERGAYINPRGLYRGERGIEDGYTVIDSPNIKPTAQLIEFEVLVTATESDEAKGGIGVVSSIINLGAQGKIAEENKLANTLRFSIPVVLPQQKF